MKPIYYFAYGSNMDMDMEQMRWRCPDAKRIDTAVLHGWKFALDEVGMPRSFRKPERVCRGCSGR